MPSMQMMSQCGRIWTRWWAMQPEPIPAMMSAHQDMASRMMDAMDADMRG